MRYYATYMYVSPEHGNLVQYQNHIFHNDADAIEYFVSVNKGSGLEKPIYCSAIRDAYNRLVYLDPREALMKQPKEKHKIYAKLVVKSFEVVKNGNVESVVDEDNQACDKCLAMNVFGILPSLSIRLQRFCVVISDIPIDHVGCLKLEVTNKYSSVGKFVVMSDTSTVPHYVSYTDIGVLLGDKMVPKNEEGAKATVYAVVYFY